VFNILTEMEKTSISNRSVKLFTLSSVYNGTLNLLNKTRHTKSITKEEESLVLDYWSHVCDNMPDWIFAAEKKVAACELRKEYIHAHGIALDTLGKLGAGMIKEGKSFSKELKKLSDIDWKRSNRALWEGRAMIEGRISKAHTCIILTSNLLKKEFRIKLSDEENKIENEYLQKI
jgi:DNA sulfur modification protein DndB